MYVTNCNLSLKLIISLTFIKILGLIIITKNSVLNIKYYSIGITVLFLYYICTDINVVYSCNVKKIELIYTGLISSIIYYIIYKYKALR